MGGCLCKTAKEPAERHRPRPSIVLGPIPHDEIIQAVGNGVAEPRFVGCEETVNATFGRLQVRYGYISQRGYYPDGTFQLSFKFEF
jgi:hypothetical protein